MLQIEDVAFNLRDVISELLKPLSIRADGKILEVICDLDPLLPDNLLGDPLRLRQILVNLLNNAIKFTPRGEVVVRASEQSREGCQVTLHFAVSDTGIGIPYEKQESIFEPFSQADGSMTRKYGGTGLGLAICRQLIETMNGRIWLESTPNRGSTFHFTVAVSLSGTASQRSASPEIARFDGLSVLVVDDNATNRTIAEKMLSNWGARSLLAEGGAHALALREAVQNSGEKVDLILLDSCMPEMHGFEFCETIRKKTFGQELRSSY